MKLALYETSIRQSWVFIFCAFLSAKITSRIYMKDKRALISVPHREYHTDVTIAPLPKPPPKLWQKIDIRCIIAGFGLHDAPCMGGIGDNDPKRSSLELHGVVSLCHSPSYKDFTSPNQPRSLGRVSGGGGAAAAPFMASTESIGYLAIMFLWSRLPFNI